ncbi:extracellular serine-rich protein [Metarhizium rileyi]|uniref:Extracellular serine-rich protein n=1 Tax=Metarhizium rileyi (strain RCEF 4871) TaxID=1649241 RepID=A0A167C9S0_METRR|nr:extracellular serine-rich protein [Metarhizium rileyi RCEF 4871]
MKTYITLLAIASLLQSGAGAPRSEAGHLQARSNQASGGGGGGIGDDIGGSIDGSALGSANGSNVGGGSNGGGAGGNGGGGSNGGGAGGDLVGTSGNPIPVVVGGPQDLFVPNLIRAQIGQTIQFQFSNGNHTVTQGKDSAGCAPITKEELKGGAEPVHSGHLPFKDGDQNVGTFDVRINSTDPILLYCATRNHCMTGQVMVINPSDEGQLIRYQKISQEVKENIDSGAPTGGTVGQIPLAQALFAPAPPKKAKGTPGEEQEEQENHQRWKQEEQGNHQRWKQEKQGNHQRWKQETQGNHQRWKQEEQENHQRWKQEEQENHQQAEQEAFHQQQRRGAHHRQ